MQSMVAGRRYDLDAMRSVLMLLGVVLHAANVYRADQRWLVADGDGSITFTAIVQFIHLFRMPAFFVVAGYFAMLSRVRRAPAGFLRDRWTRLLVPFAVTLATFNVVQEILLGVYGVSGSTTGLSEYLRNAWLRGEFIGHLWFLAVLALYCGLMALDGPWLRSWPRAVGWRGLERRSQQRVVIALLSLTPLAVAVVGRLTGPWFYGTFAGLVSPASFVFYLPFFAMGAMLYRSPTALSIFSRPSHLDIAVTVLAAAIWIVIGTGQGGGLGVAVQVVRALSAWGAVRLVFYLFWRLASRPSATFTYLSDASYSVYLVHHVQVIVLALALRQWDGPTGAKFVLVIGATAAGSLAFHHWGVRPFPSMQFLFNGKVTRSAS